MKDAAQRDTLTALDFELKQRNRRCHTVEIIGQEAKHSLAVDDVDIGTLAGADDALCLLRKSRTALAGRHKIELKVISPGFDALPSFFCLACDGGGEVLAVRTERIIVCKSASEVGECEDVTSFLGAVADLLAILSLDDEHLACRLVDVDRVKALVSWSTYQGSNRLFLSVGDEALHEPRDE